MPTVLGLPLIAALTWSGVHGAPGTAAPQVDSAPESAVIHSTDTTATLPFLGARSGAVESGATVTPRFARGLPRWIRPLEQDQPDRSWQAGERSRVRMNALEALDFSHALTRIRCGALSSLATSTPPPSA